MDRRANPESLGWTAPLPCAMEAEMTTSEPQPEAEFMPARSLSLAALAAEQGLQPIASVDELAVDLWAADELDAFLATVNADRRASIS